MNKPFLITGATGTVGRALVRRLQNAGVDLLAGSTSGAPVEGVPGRVVRFDQPDTLDAAFAEAGRVFLLFPLQPDKLALARNAIDAARRAGVEHIVRSSGAGADTASPAAIGKLQGDIDALVADSGLPYTLLRPNSFMQNWVNFYGDMVRSGTVYLANGDGRSSWIDAGDIAEAAAQVLLKPQAHAGRAYDLTGPAALSAQEVLDVIRAEAGVQARYQPVSLEDAAHGMAQAGMPAWTIDILNSLSRLIAAGDTAGVSPDLERLIGRPGRDFHAFAREHASAWQ